MSSNYLTFSNWKSYKKLKERYIHTVSNWILQFLTEQNEVLFGLEKQLILLFLYSEISITRFKYPHCVAGSRPKQNAFFKMQNFCLINMRFIKVDANFS